MLTRLVLARVLSPASILLSRTLLTLLCALLALLAMLNVVLPAPVLTALLSLSIGLLRVFVIH